MSDLITELKSFLLTEPLATKPVESDFPSRSDYLRAKIAWMDRHESRPNPPASPSDIDQLRSRFHHPLPAIVMDLFGTANGNLKIRPGLRLMSTEEALDMNRVYSEFDEEVYPIHILRTFLPMFHQDKIDIGLFITGSASPPVHAIDVWDTKVCYLGRSLESYLQFIVRGTREGVFPSSTESSALAYSEKESKLATEIEGPDNIFPLAQIEGKTFFSLYSGSHWPGEIVNASI